MSLSFDLHAATTEALPSPPIVVALSAIDVPESLEPLRARASAFDSLIAAALAREGYAIAPAMRTDSVWAATLAARGGVYDPVTGQRDTLSYRSARAEALRLIAAGSAAVWLVPRIELVRVEWKGGSGKWDGASETVAPVGSGVVAGLSLVLAVIDTSGADIGEGRGGIQVLAKASLWNSRWSNVPEEKLLADEKRNAKAVRLAIEGLRRRAKARSS